MQLLGSGTIFREVIEAAALLKADWGVASDLWSCPSFTELARDGMAVARDNLMNPAGKAKTSHVARCLDDTSGPVIAATDYMRAFAEQIRAYVPRRYVVLGTDGFGRSDTREKTAALFRGRSILCHRRRAEGARGRGCAACGEGRRGDEEVRARSGEARAVDRVAGRPPKRGG